MMLNDHSSERPSVMHAVALCSVTVYPKLWLFWGRRTRAKGNNKGPARDEDVGAPEGPKKVFYTLSHPCPIFPL